MILLVAAFSPAAYSCSLIEGNFYQVTHLRGTVVGVDDHDFRHTIRWMRHQAVLPQVALSVYIYDQSGRNEKKAQPIKSVRSDKDGTFDFGLLPPGHYTVLIDAPWGEDRFDVQITTSATRTKSVMIDVSPIFPDCTGGHEFVVNNL